MKTKKIGFIKKATIITTVALATLLGGFLGGCKSDRDHTPTIIEQPIPIPSTSQRQELEESLLEHYGTLTKTQEPHLLQDHIMHEYATEGDGFVTATQTLEFGTLTPKMEKETLGNVDIFMHSPANTELYTWKSEFTDGFTSRISNGRLIDLIQQDINIGGKNYRITEATTQWLGGNLDEVTIDMLTGKVALALNETESSVLRVDGLDYEVEVVSTYTDASGNSSARFQVNGEMTSNLFSGDTFTLANGQQIGVYTAGTGWVEFGLGVQSLRTKDTDINDDTSEGTVSGSGIFGSYGNNSQSRVKIKGSVDTANNTLTLDSLAITLMSNAAQGVFVEEGHGLSEALDKPGAAIIEVDFHGLKTDKTDGAGTVPREYATTEFTYATNELGDIQYLFSFTNKENIAYTDVPLVNNDGTQLRLGQRIEDTLNAPATIFNKLVMTEGSSETDHNIAAGNMFVVNGSSDFTHILTYDSWDATERKLSFTDLATGARECTYDSTTGQANLVMGGQTFMVYVDQTDGSLAIDLNGDGVFDSSAVKIVDKCGGELSITQTDSDTIDAKVNTAAEKIDGSDQDENVGMTLTRSGADIATSLPLAQYALGIDEKRGQSRYGVLAQHNPVSNGVKLHYPEIQEEPSASLTEQGN